MNPPLLGRYVGLLRYKGLYTDKVGIVTDTYRYGRLVCSVRRIHMC